MRHMFAKSTEELNDFYKQLRLKEKHASNQFLEKIGAEEETKILLNRRFKFEHKQENLITDLENAVFEAECRLVCIFVAELFQENRYKKLTTLPFPGCDVSLEEYNNTLEEYASTFNK